MRILTALSALLLLLAFACSSTPKKSPESTSSQSSEQTATAVEPDDGVGDEKFSGDPNELPDERPEPLDENGGPEGEEGDPCNSAGDCISGICEGEGCGPLEGRCAPARRMCTKDLRPYCGCDGKEFSSSGSCPGQRYEKRGQCN